MGMSPDTPVCYGCGYNLTGLSRQGRCPECGTPYDLDRPAPHFRRPPLGFALLLAPAALLFYALLAAMANFNCLMGLPLTALACPLLAWLIADQIAQWRASEAVRAVRDDAWSAHRRLARARRWGYFVLQLLVLPLGYVAFIYVSRYLVQIGWLRAPR